MFGRLFGREVWEHVAGETSLLAEFHGHFDRILLDGGKEWFAPEDKGALLT